MPLLNPTGLVGSVLYADTQFDNTRYNIAVVQSFVEAGGRALNYVRVLDFRRGLDGRISGVVARDQIADRRFAFNAKVVINATGTTSDAIRRLATPAVGKRVDQRKAAQILLPLEVFPTKDALLVPETRQSKALFAVPWNGRILVGTTDRESNAEMTLTEKDVDSLLGNMNRFISRTVKPIDVVSGVAEASMCLAGGDKDSPEDLESEQTIEVDPDSALISILGANQMTHWSTAESTINLVQDIIGLTRSHSHTWNHVLYGSERFADEFWKRPLVGLNLSHQTVNHLACKFGTATENILKLAQRNTDLAAPLVRGYPAIKSEVIYSVREEMAATIEDVLARRIGLQHYSWKMAMAAAPVVGALMAEELRWSDRDASNAIKDYLCKIRDLLGAAGLS
jgi:glycerol-3-phosphate dehydrogenase